MLCASIHRMSATSLPSLPGPQRQSQASIALRILVLAILLGGFGLRLVRFGAESLWYDETVSAFLAAQPITDLVAHTARDIHPPGYYLLLHLWRTVARPSVAFGLEFLLAWPSLWLSLPVMALTYAVARRCFNQIVALWALVLAAIHPTQVWFAQEVRMYALGACCVMLTLWAVTPILAPRARAVSQIGLPWRTRLLYPLAALAGIYTLYYFLFWLFCLNLGIFVILRARRRLLVEWSVLQLLLVVGWLPWLSTFLRQAISPPVPAWRVAWQSPSEMLNALAEAVTAQWLAHTFPLGVIWPWSLAVIALTVVYFVYAKDFGQPRWRWLLFSFGPPLLLFAVSLLGPPIYHVRYVATYAPVFPILIAVALARLARPAAAVLFACLLGLSTLSIRQLMLAPQFAADDHRAAVALLAREWRPHDAIIVNAGWAYTAIATYWPDELPTPDATRPPALDQIVRLTPQGVGAISDKLAVPVLLRTGSVDGDATLGWGLPESDFFATSLEDTQRALSLLAQDAQRLWHYRIYDTVSDPDATIRTWLHGHTVPFLAQSIPGRDFLLLEGFMIAAPPRSPSSAPPFAVLPDRQLELVSTAAAHPIPAGEYLYVRHDWHNSQHAPRTDVALSLRMVDGEGQMISQQDTALTMQIGTDSVQTLALPVPADTIPGEYQVALIAYAPDTLAPYTWQFDAGAQHDTVLPLGAVTVTLPTTIPTVTSTLAAFDYIDLVTVQLPAMPVASGESVPVELTWRPRQSAYRDHYVGQWTLVDAQGAESPLASFDLGAPTYLSSAWTPQYPLRQRTQIPLPGTLSPGAYTLRLRVARASDGHQIAARVPWQLWKLDAVNVGTIRVGEGQ